MISDLAPVKRMGSLYLFCNVAAKNINGAEVGKTEALRKML